MGIVKVNIPNPNWLSTGMQRMRTTGGKSLDLAARMRRKSQRGKGFGKHRPSRHRGREAAPGAATSIRKSSE